MTDPSLSELAKLAQTAKNASLSITLVVGGAIIDGTLTNQEDFLSYLDRYNVNDESEAPSPELRAALRLGGDVLYLRAPRITLGNNNGETCDIRFTHPIMRVAVARVDAWFLGHRP